MLKPGKSALLIAFMSLVVSAPAHASFHLMQIEQIIGGVDGDATAQAIQLRMRAGLQNLVQNGKLVVRDAAGANPIVVANPGVSVPNQGTGVTVLFASANFASVTSPAVVPDFPMLALIPATYLAAGSLTFEDNAGLTIIWRVSGGGGGYTGSHLGSITNDADGRFGPAFGGPLPSTSLQAVHFTGAAADLSTRNVDNYALTTGAAVFTNNGGSNFTVQSVVSAVRSPWTGAALAQNYPNPFNPSTSISFSLAVASDVNLTIYDASGREVAKLIDGFVGVGEQIVDWSGRDNQGESVSSGVYFYRLVTQGETLARKMVLLK